MDDLIVDGIAVVINDLPLGTYVTWFEEKGAAQELFRGVVGFGRDVTMLLNGDTGQQLQSIEVRIAAAYRLKGPDKQTEMESIGQLLSQIHLDGCKDPRLRMMADAIKLKLPRRSSRKR